MYTRVCTHTYMCTIDGTSRPKWFLAPCVTLSAITHSSHMTVCTYGWNWNAMGGAKKSFFSHFPTHSKKSQKS